MLIEVVQKELSQVKTENDRKINTQSFLSAKPQYLKTKVPFLKKTKNTYVSNITFRSLWDLFL